MAPNVTQPTDGSILGIGMLDVLHIGIPGLTFGQDPTTQVLQDGINSLI
jgi:hypothetical protein